MEIKFNVTGARRKELVEAVGQIVGWEPVYKGAPTFAYAIADFNVDKDGTLTGDITHVMLDELADRGFTVLEIGSVEHQPDYENWSEPVTPENAPDTMGDPSDDISAYLPSQTEFDEPTDHITIEVPKDGFNDATIANLEKLIESKAPLIKRALGVAALPVEQTDETLRFPWLASGTSDDEIDACTHFIAALCKMAKEQARVTAKAKDVDNEKYAFRCFLLRLGFIGKEFAAVRKILLQRLSGNSSFKSGERRQSAPVEAQAEMEAAAGE